MTGSTGRRAAVLLAVVVWTALPLNVGDTWLNILAYAGVAAIGAIGLNLLTGSTGQVSLGHAFFVGCGAYVVAWAGARHELPMPVWLVLAAAVGAAVGGAAALITVRVRGDQLAILTVGLIYGGGYAFKNWTSLTGGGNGTRTAVSFDIGPVRFEELSLFGERFTREQGVFWLVWALVALGVVLARNLLRSRTGRAMQAVREREVAAESLGIRVAHVRAGAFAVAGAYAAVAGALYAGLQRYVDPAEFGGLRGLALSIAAIAAIVLGGLGSVIGGVIGATLLGVLPFLARDHAGSLPVTGWEVGGEPLLPAEILTELLHGVLIVGLLLFEPRGLAALWPRMTALLPFRTRYRPTRSER